MYSAATAHVVSSFYRLPLKPGIGEAAVIPPVLREEVRARQPQDLGHVLAYQGYETFPGFVTMLRGMERRVVAYGLGPARREGNCEFRDRTADGFLSDLAACSYVVCGGGHTLISEALFLGKPVLSFPIAWAYEQHLNARYLAKLGYGMMAAPWQAGPRLVAAFERRLDEYHQNLAAGIFDGNDQLQRLVGRFLERGALQAN